jgi:dUTPase
MFTPLPTNQVALLLSDTLVTALAAHRQDPDSYAPAYNGESVGLDLYNAGPKLIIPPMSKLSKYANMGRIVEQRKGLTWLDFPEEARTLVAKKFMQTGIRAVIPRGYGGFIWERGSITKTPIKCRAGVIDPGYTGYIFVNVVNVSQVPFVLEAGAKSPFQLVIQKINTNFKTVNEKEFAELSANSARQTGMVGSSD